MKIGGILKTALLTLIVFGTGLRAQASSIYYDQAAWDAATSQFNSGPYPLPVTRTDYQDTIEILGPPDYGLALVGTSTSAGTTDFSNFDTDFSYASACEFDPGCLITGDTEIVFDLPTPIFGFSGMAYIGPSAEFTINGLVVDDPTGGGGYSGFFGVLSDTPIDIIDIIDETGFTDNPVGFGVNSISVLTTVDEPPGLILFLAALLMFVGLRTSGASARAPALRE